MESGNGGFGIRNPANGIRNPTIIVIQNPGCWLWNPESTDMESEIHSVESGIQDSLGLPYMGRNKKDSNMKEQRRNRNSANLQENNTTTKFITNRIYYITKKLQINLILKVSSLF